MDTMIINPVSAAIGSFSIRLEPNIMNTSSIMAATIPESLALAPDDIFIRLCPIIAQPPIPESSPERIFAAPCATASLLPLPLVCVISSMILSVKRLSMSPTPATIAA